MKRLWHKTVEAFDAYMNWGIQGSGTQFILWNLSLVGVAVALTALLCWGISFITVTGDGPTTTIEISNPLHPLNPANPANPASPLHPMHPLNPTNPNGINRPMSYRR